MWTVLTVLCLATGALARKQFIVGGADVDIADFPWQVRTWTLISIFLLYNHNHMHSLVNLFVHIFPFVLE